MEPRASSETLADLQAEIVLTLSVMVKLALQIDRRAKVECKEKQLDHSYLVPFRKLTNTILLHSGPNLSLKESFSLEET